MITHRKPPCTNVAVEYQSPNAVAVTVVTVVTATIAVAVVAVAEPQAVAAT